MAWRLLKGRNGSKVGVAGTDNNGKNVTLLNPNGKGAKFARELKDGTRYTNTGEQKKTKNGKNVRLSDTQRAWRGGYLAARKDNARAFNANAKKNKSK